jgi:pyruvate/2-oxoglutarate dehydrogenase complex dihydrolipoamide dehydrogenase (E3) component
MDCRHAVRSNLKVRATLHAQTHATAIERLGDGSLRLSCRSGDAGAESALEVDQVLMAVGRTPRTANLGLEVSRAHTTSLQHVPSAVHVELFVPWRGRTIFPDSVLRPCC